MIAVTVAKNEADIIRTTVEHLLTQGCRVVVADNLSSDGTAEELIDLPDVHIVRDEDPAHRQGAKMTALAGQYANEGEWVIPFDADELWWNLDFLSDEIDVATAHPHVHYGPLRQPGVEPHPKTAFRWHKGARIDEGNHYVFGAGRIVADGLLDVCHYQYRTLEQVRRKVTQGTAALNAAGMGETTGTHWRDLARLDDNQLSRWFDDYIAKANVLCRLSQP